MSDREEVRIFAESKRGKEIVCFLGWEPVRELRYNEQILCYSLS
jgi:hypothetical protein